VSTPTAAALTSKCAGSTPALPNFFLVGAPKAGTTSLYHYLGQHPEVYMSPVKEPHYFADEIRVANFSEDFQRMAAPRRETLRVFLEGPMTTRVSAGPVEEFEDYRRLFQRVDGQKAVGEASVCYLWSTTAPANIARTCPQARILMVLRDPVARAFSAHLHTLSSANSNLSFREQVDAALASRDRRFSELYPFLQFGLYYEQVRRYLGLFPRERVGIFFYHDYVRDAARFLRGIFRFLEVDAGFVPNVSARYTEPRVPRSYRVQQLLKRSGAWELARAVAPAKIRPMLKRMAFVPKGALRIDPEDRVRLIEFYREDVEKLAELLGRDLGAWLRV
jgi:hypothetical protein